MNYENLNKSVQNLKLEIDIEYLENEAKKLVIEQLEGTLSRLVNVKVDMKTHYMQERIGQMVGKYVRENLSEKIREIVLSTDIEPIAKQAIERNIHKQVENLFKTLDLSGVQDD